MALRPTPPRRVGALSTLLANSALYAGHLAHLSSPFATLVLGGALLRVLATLPLTVYGDQCLARSAAALPELQVAHRQYTDIVNHPRAIHWEKRVAAQKLANDRERIFRSFRTNNVKTTAPHGAGLLLSWYLLGVPAQQLGEFFTVDVGMQVVSPLSLTFLSMAAGGGGAAVGGGGASALSFGSSSWIVMRSVDATAAVAAAGGGVSSASLVVLDPTLTLAATLTAFNVFTHLRRRKGFNDRLDAYIADAGRLCWVGYGAAALAGLAAGPLAAATGAAAFFPSYLAPMWLGMALTTAAKTALVNGTAPGRALFQLPPYPPEHGTYGGESTAEGHEYRLAFTSVDAEEKREVWQSQKRALDYECDVRLHKMLAKTGLMDGVEEMEHEAEKIRERLAITHERKLRKQQQQQKQREEDGNADASSSSLSSTDTSGMTVTERRRAARAEKRQRLEESRAAKAEQRRTEIAAAAADAKAKGEDKWRAAVSATAGMPASSFSSENEPVAGDFAAQYLDEYNTDRSQSRVDRLASRAAVYRQRSPVSPAETLLGSKEAAAAAEAANAAHEDSGQGGRGGGIQGR